MRHRALAVTLLLILTALASPAEAQQRPDPESPRYKGVQALQAFLQSEGDEALQAFADDHVSTSYREELGDELMRHLTELRETFAGLESRGARPSGPLGATMMFADNKTVTFELDEEDPARFNWIESNT